MTHVPETVLAIARDPGTPLDKARRLASLLGFEIRSCEAELESALIQTRARKVIYLTEGLPDPARHICFYIARDVLRHRADTDVWLQELLPEERAAYEEERDQAHRAAEVLLGVLSGKNPDEVP